MPPGTPQHFIICLMRQWESLLFLPRSEVVPTPVYFFVSIWRLAVFSEWSRWNRPRCKQMWLPSRVRCDGNVMLNTPPSPHYHHQVFSELIHLFPCTWLSKSVCSELVAKESNKENSGSPFGYFGHSLDLVPDPRGQIYVL